MHKGDCAKRDEDYVNEGILQFTLRRLQGVIRAPRFWMVLIAVAVVLAVAGPFDTLTRMTLLPRFAYWLAVALSTFLAGYAAIGFMVHFLLGDLGNRPVRLAIAGFAAGVPVTAVVLVLNHLIFGDGFGTPAEILGFYVNCSLISAAISLLFGLVDSREDKGILIERTADPERPAALTDRPPLLDRLPPHLRWRLLYLSMQDHYVDVRTDRGGTLVLMRLADAIAETRGVDGLQIHRSHWIARDAVETAERSNRRLSLRMSDGAVLPVSRSCLAAVRGAGLG